SEPVETLAFLVTKFVVGVVAYVLVSIVVALGMVALAIPLVLLGLVVYFVSPALLLVPLVLGILGLLVLSFGVTVPVQTYVFTWVLGVHARFAGLEFGGDGGAGDGDAGDVDDDGAGEAGETAGVGSASDARSAA
ncbi:MAG: DUF7544 domain-containing protein, partial [Halobacteriota archaeon]